MYFYRSCTEEAELFYIPDNVTWNLVATMEPYGMEYLSIYVGESGYEIRISCSYELREDVYGLAPCEAMEFYGGMIAEIARQVSDKNVNCIDLHAIQEKLMPEYLKKWKEEGVINLET